MQLNGLNRNRLTTDTAYAVCANTSAGNLSVVAPLTNTAIYYDSNARATAGALPALSGGTGLQYVFTTVDAEKVLQINSAGSALTFGVPPNNYANKIYAFYRFG